MLDVESLEWHQLLDIPNNNPRLWHKACFTPDRDLLIFGGCCNDILSNNNSSVSSSNNQFVVDVNDIVVELLPNLL